MPGREASPFANNFRIGPDGSREDVLAKNKAQLLTRLAEDPQLALALQRLKGKRLGCWCKPLACHGDFLVELLEGPAPEEPQPESC
jgi:hypothetical protein